MAGLMDYLSNLKFEPDAKSMGLMNMAANMLQASNNSPTPVSFGNALGAGLNGFTGGYQVQKNLDDTAAAAEQKKLLDAAAINKDNALSKYYEGEGRKTGTGREGIPVGYRQNPNDPNDIIPMSVSGVNGQKNYFDIQQANSLTPNYGETDKLIMSKNADIRAANADSRSEESLQLQKDAANQPKPLTEFQGKSAMFGSKAQQAHEILNNIGTDYSAPAIGAAGSVEDTPLIGWGANAMLSDNDQKIMQAQKSFLTSVLRQESGASISPSEFSVARKQYFPQPGDSAETIAQKTANREMVIKGFQTTAGPNASSSFTSASAPKETKVIDGKTYTKINGEWHGQ